MSQRSERRASLTRALIRCPSVTPQDGGALGVLEERLKAAGFTTHRLRFSEPGAPDIDNLYARIGSGAPYLVFAGHTDVVPPGETPAWRFDPFSAEIAEGEVWGRGAADMKGAVAAFTAAALDYVATHQPLKGSIGLLITGDEEGPAVNGTVKLLQWAAEQGEHFDHCLVGEPTNVEALGDTIKIGRRGSLTGTLDRPRHAGPCRLSAARRQSHSASSAPADGADRAAARRWLGGFRSEPSRNPHRRCRQSGDECDSGDGARRASTFASTISGRRRR